MTQPFEQPAEEPKGPEPQVPPHSVETEQAVLSAWSLHERFGKAWKPEAELFFVPAHRIIAAAMARLDPSTRDEASVIAQLDADGQLGAIGGKAMAIRVIKTAPAYGDPWPHVNRLREYKALRDVISASTAAIAEAFEHKNLGAVVAKLQDAIRLGSQEMQARILSVHDMLVSVAKEMMTERDPEKCRTGLSSLDQHIGGYQHKQCTIFGASTNWGKSSYAVLVSDLAFDDGKRPLLVSFEDPEELYGRRLAARRAELNPNVLRSGKYAPSDDQWTRMLTVAERAEKTPFFMNAIGKTVERVATDIRCVCASEKIDIVMVDYLQAIQCAKRHQDRRNEVTYIARTLTDVIKTSGCSGLMFSQFKRPLKPGQRPTMHDLKESGDLENAAENVLIGYQEKDGQRVIRSEKVKDGLKHKEYLIGWNETTCGFTGEIEVKEHAEPLDEYDGRWG